MMGELYVSKDHEMLGWAAPPTQVEFLSPIIHASIGGLHMVAVDIKGGVYQILYDTTVDIFTPIPVPISAKCTLVSAGLEYALALSDEGQVFAWTFVNPAVIFPVKGLEKETITDIKAGNQEALLLTKNKTVFKYEHVIDNVPSATLIPKLTNIRTISASFVHFLALQRADLPPLSEWEPREVAEWFVNMGLSEYHDIIVHNKISGKMIIEGDDDFFLDNMGLSSVA